MSRTYIPHELQRLVRARANQQCEYCLLPQDAVFVPHEIDHIIAEQHQGETVSENLALACLDCNRKKGPNIASIDPADGEIVRLFNPRKDRWTDHFELDNSRIIPLTAIGRATVQLLVLNAPDQLLIRKQISM